MFAEINGPIPKVPLMKAVNGGGVYADSGVSIWGEYGEDTWVKSGVVAPLSRFFWSVWPPNWKSS